MWSDIKSELKRTPVWIWGIIAFGVCIRLAFAVKLDFHADELYGVLASKMILEKGVPIYPSGTYRIVGGPILYLQAIPFAIFGLTEWAFRLPTVLLSIPGLWFLYYFGLKLFDRQIAIVVLLLCTIDFGMIFWGGVNSKPYSVLIYLVPLCFLAVRESALTSGIRTVLIASVLLVLTVWIHPLVCFYLPAFAVAYIFWKRRIDWTSVAMALVTALGVAIVLYSVRAGDPGVLMSAKASRGIVVKNLPILNILDSYIREGPMAQGRSYFSLDSRYLLYWPAQFVLFATVGWILTCSWQSITKNQKMIDIAILSVFVVLSLFCFRLFQYDQPGYLLPLIPFYFLLGCYGLSYLIRGDCLGSGCVSPQSKRVTKRQIVFSLIMLCLFLWGNVHIVIKELKKNDGSAKAAYSYVKSHSLPGDAYFGANPSTFLFAAGSEPIFYYYTECPNLGLMKLPDGSFGDRILAAPWIRTPGELEKVFKKHDRLWMISTAKSRYNNKKTSNVIDKYMKKVAEYGTYYILFYDANSPGAGVSIPKKKMPDDSL